jgi:hypothetical protein
VFGVLGDHVWPVTPGGEDRAPDGEVAGLGARPGEHDSAATSPDESGDLVAGLIQCDVRAVAVVVVAGRLPNMVLRHGCIASATAGSTGVVAL